MSRVVLDDHLLRDLLASDVPMALAGVLETHEPATTNLYLYRLSRSIASTRGGALTGRWSDEQRQALASMLLSLPKVEIVPMRQISYRMAEIAGAHRLSTLGAETVAAAEHLGAPICAWDGDVGPAVRTATADLGIDFWPISR